MSSISDHSLVYTVLKLKTPRTKSSYVSVRSYTNYKPELFLKDLYCVPFHMVNFFDDFNDQVDAFNSLFLDVLNEHAPIKRIKIKSRPNPFITREIRELMRTRDRWHKSAIKTNDPLHWNAYRLFRQEVKKEIRLAEKVHVRSEILNSNGNTNAIWKVIDRCLPKKATSRPRSTEDPAVLANKFNESFTSVGSITALKAECLAKEHLVIVKHDSVPGNAAVENTEQIRFHSVNEKEVETVSRNLPCTRYGQNLSTHPQRQFTRHTSSY